VDPYTRAGGKPVAPERPASLPGFVFSGSEELILSTRSPGSAGCPAHWFDRVWWEHQIDRAIATPDPALANLRITVAHYQLSLALRATLDPGGGANFHTWATWGSKKAGTTIRQEDAPHLPTLARWAGCGLGLLGGAVLGSRGRDAALLTALLGGWGAEALTRQRLDYASRLILRGNIVVIDEIGRQTARFVSAFHGHPAPDAERLAGFLDALRPGPTAAGGQDLLRHAFTYYYRSRYTCDPAAAREHLLLGNLYAILHEHIRLQPYIAGAMPRPARRLITRRLLHFVVGRRTMSAAQDVTLWAGAAGVGPLPPVANAELRRFLAGPGGWDRSVDGVRGSRAANWADIRDRMNFICALFRTGHDDPDLFTAPYTAAQCAEIAAGRIPGGAL
jgi:hypothetical protein